MATRMYFNSVPQTTISAAVNASWASSYASFDRYFLETTANSAFSTKTGTASFAGGSAVCIGQWWSHPISNASSFTSANWNASTWTVLVRWSESSATADYVYRYQLRIYDPSGGTFPNNSFFSGATEFDVGDGSVTNSLMESRRISLGDYWGAIGPFSNGIRLVMELGIQRLGAVAAASFTGYCEVGGNSGTDLTNSETDVSQSNPYMECSLNFTFDAEAGGNSNQLAMQGAGT